MPFCAPVAFAATAGWAQPASSAALTVGIPAQPLAQALSALASQTGLQVVYISGLIRNQQSRAIPADMPVEQALTQLLQGTGLRFEYLTAHSIRILAVAQPPNSTQSAREDELSEIMVTANRRDERLQDVPITIDVLTEAMLARLNATTFDDFLGYLSGVTAHGVGRSQNNLYLRGLGVGDSGIQAGGFLSPFPQVAIYLDEQSVQLPGRNLDLYTADLVSLAGKQAGSGRVRWNGALYQEQWNHAQFGALDNSVTGISALNGGDYRLRGLETSGAVRLLDGPTALRSTGPCYRLTRAKSSPIRPVPWPARWLGAPTFRSNLRSRYERMLGEFLAFAQLGVVTQFNSLASTDRPSLDAQGHSIAYDLPPFTTLDGAVGISKDGWQVQLYGQNLSDTRAQLFESSNQFYTAITVNRPRTVGLQVSYRIRRDQS